MKQRVHVVSVLAMLSISALSCAVDKHDDGTPLNPVGDTGGFQFDGGGDSVSLLDTDGTDTKIDPDAACAAVREQADVAPVDLFVMFDKSSSMTTKWTPAKNGLTTFLKDPASGGLRVSINFFPRPPDATPECDQPAYSRPRVPFGALPANADPIITAMSSETPNGFGTPMYPALGGAILGAWTEVKGRPGDRGAVLLVTDGEPEGPTGTCGGVTPTDPKVIADLAASGVSKLSPSISTFVIGLPGVNIAIADQIAAAGGTTAAIVIADPSKIESGFQAALEAVRGKSLPCEFALPTKVTKGEVSYDKVNVDYTKGSGGDDVIPQSSDCSKGGWHYDDPVHPTKIVLCPSTCAEVHADPKAKIEILLGCKTIIK